MRTFTRSIYYLDAMRMFILVSVLLFSIHNYAQDSLGYTPTCTASFYAKKFEGRRCANGDVFRHDSLTAAHKTFAFGTLVKVINLKNDSMVIVRINDRLPKRSKRCIDLTRRAARQLNFIRQGLTSVKLEVLIETPQ